ncbi:MAG: chemoreceptor glutamine deamidase CheD, partial [Alcaligenaceae bacterium]
MTTNRPALPPTSAALPFAAVERRRAPRIAPLSADIYSPSTATGAAKESSLQELKASPRKPGEASFFFADHHFQHNAVKVLPGEYFVTEESMVIMTVLGSCIAACLW